MGRRPLHVYRDNARLGAIRTWCPGCKRKAALSARKGTVWMEKGQLAGELWRECRYCGAEVEGGSKADAARLRMYRKWEEEQQGRPEQMDGRMMPSDKLSESPFLLKLCCGEAALGVCSTLKRNPIRPLMVTKIDSGAGLWYNVTQA